MSAESIITAALRHDSPVAIDTASPSHAGGVVPLAPTSAPAALMPSSDGPAAATLPQYLGRVLIAALLLPTLLTNALLKLVVEQHDAASPAPATWGVTRSVKWPYAAFAQCLTIALGVAYLYNDALLSVFLASLVVPGVGFFALLRRDALRCPSLTSYFAGPPRSDDDHRAMFLFSRALECLQICCLSFRDDWYLRCVVFAFDDNTAVPWVFLSLAGVFVLACAVAMSSGGHVTAGGVGCRDGCPTGHALRDYTPLRATVLPLADALFPQIAISLLLGMIDPNHANAVRVGCMVLLCQYIPAAVVLPPLYCTDGLISRARRVPGERTECVAWFLPIPEHVLHRGFCFAAIACATCLTNPLAVAGTVGAIYLLLCVVLGIVQCPRTLHPGARTAYLAQTAGVIWGSLVAVAAALLPGPAYLSGVWGGALLLGWLFIALISVVWYVRARSRIHHFGTNAHTMSSTRLHLEESVEPSPMQEMVSAPASPNPGIHFSPGEVPYSPKGADKDTFSGNVGVDPELMLSPNIYAEPMPPVEDALLTLEEEDDDNSKVEITMEDDVIFEFGPDSVPPVADGSSWNACEDEEDLSQYCVGGYHRVAVGEVFNDKYVALAKLGWGEFSTVWLARDVENGTHVALKISKASEEHRVASDYEIDVYEVLNRTLQAEDAPVEAEFVMRMYEYFEHTGPHGTHLVTVAELLGPNLLKLISAHNFRGIDPDIVRVVVRQVLCGLTFLHHHGIVHSDVKPENILLVAPSEAVMRHMGAELGQDDMDRVAASLRGTYTVQAEETLMEALFRQYGAKLSDLGSARYTDRQYPVCVLQTREYRAPEVILGVEHIETAADMWSVACMTFELLTGDFLFDPKVQDTYDKDLYHMALFQRMLGEAPTPFATSGTLSRHFFNTEQEDGGFFLGPNIEPTTLKENAMAYGVTEEDAEALAAFLAPMLVYDPEFRATAREMLAHPWLQVSDE